MSNDKNPQAEPSWSDRANEFLSVFSKGAQFTEELISENRRLRLRMAAMEQEKADGASAGNVDEALVRLQRKLDDLQSRHDAMLNKIKNVEQENQDFAQRYLEIEEENNNLANLYIASFQLHSTLNFREVLQIIQEIVINLIGAETFCVYVLDVKEKVFKPAASEGIELSALRTLAIESSALARRMVGPEVHIQESALGTGTTNPDNPLVIIPLAIKHDCVGAISIFTLLEQKHSIAAVDRELFTLLAGHAATAIFSSRLYMESERKLNTMQGFIDLLTK